MKYCTMCGQQIMDEAVICPHCGCEVAQRSNTAAKPSDTLKTIAKIFMVIACAIVGFLALIYGFIGIVVGAIVGDAAGIAILILFFFFAIPLSWLIPMTVYYWKQVKRKMPVSMAFKVCTLIFVNIVAGILMLCDSDQ